MRTRWLSRLTVVGCAGLLWAASACVVGDTRAVNGGYGYGYASASASAGVGVGEPSTATVSSLPPEPLYEQMTVSPGFGYVWIDGYWHWNSYEWVWVSGRWVREQGAAYVYVQPCVRLRERRVRVPAGLLGEPRSGAERLERA